MHHLLHFLKKVPKANAMTLDANNQIHSSLKNKVETFSWYLHTRANNVNTENIIGQEYHQPPKYEFFTECTRNKDYASNVVLPNGQVTLCCMDYSLKHVLGNLLHQSYDEILESTEMQKVKRLSNTIGFTEDLLCKSCNDAHCKTPWNSKEVWNIVAKTNPDILGID